MHKQQTAGTPSEQQLDQSITEKKPESSSTPVSHHISCGNGAAVPIFTNPKQQE